MARRLLKDTCALAAEILDGKHDDDLAGDVNDIIGPDDPDEDGTVWEKVEVCLLVVPADGDRIPGHSDGSGDKVSVEQIAEEVLEAAFRKAHDEITALTGLRFSGDLMPGEQFALERLASMIVRSVLVNGPLCVKCGSQVERLTSDVDGSVEFVCANHGAVPMDQG